MSHIRNCIVMAASAFIICAKAFSFEQHNTLTTIPANTALDLGKYTCDSPDGDPKSCTTITSFSGFTYDPFRQKMYMFGGGHAATFRDDVDVFHFDSLSWKSDYTPTACSDMVSGNLDMDKGAWNSSGHPVSRHTYDLLVVTRQKEFLMMRPGGGDSYCANGPSWYPKGRVGHYNPDSKKWSWGDSMEGKWASHSSAEFDPVSGQVIILGNRGSWLYDPAKKTSRKLSIKSPAGFGYANNLIYFPPNDKFYYIKRGDETEVLEFTPNRANWNNSTIAEVTINGKSPKSVESGWAYDNVNKIIGGGVQDGIFYAFDPFTRSWTSKVIKTLPVPNTSVGKVRSHALDFDTVNGVFLFISTTGNTWAYRYGKDGGQFPQIISAPEPIAVVGQPYKYDGDSKVNSRGNEPATYSLITGPDGMSVSNEGLITWTPGNGQEGDHPVKIRATNNAGEDVQSYIITVTHPDASSLGPVANEDTVTAIKDTALVIAVSDLLSNDTGFNGNPITITGVSAPYSGSVSLNNNTITFTPNRRHTGKAYFTYHIVSHDVTASARVTVKVIPPTAPKISHSQPASGATEVSPDTEIVLRFDKPLNPSTINNSNIFLTVPPLDIIPVILDYSDSPYQVKIKPRGELQLSTQHELVIGTELMDEEGNAFGGAIIGFETQTYKNNSEIVTVDWSLPSSREDGSILPISEIAGYTLFYGTAPGSYSQSININDSRIDNYSIELATGRTYYFSILARDIDGMESVFASEASIILK